MYKGMVRYMEALKRWDGAQWVEVVQVNRIEVLRPYVTQGFMGVTVFKALDAALINIQTVTIELG